MQTHTYTAHSRVSQWFHYIMNKQELTPCHSQEPVLKAWKQQVATLSTHPSYLSKLASVSKWSLAWLAYSVTIERNQVASVSTRLVNGNVQTKKSRLFMAWLAQQACYYSAFWNTRQGKVWQFWNLSWSLMFRKTKGTVEQKNPIQLLYISPQNELWAHKNNISSKLYWIALTLVDHQ